MATAARGVVSRSTARAGGSEVEAVDALAGDDLASEGAELGRQGVGHGGRPAADHRPADGVGVHPQHEPERCRQRPVERDHRVRRERPEERPSRLAAEPAARQALGGSKGRQTEPREGQRVARHVHDRTEQLLRELPRVADERPEQPQPGAAVVGPAVTVQARRGHRERSAPGPPHVRRRGHGRAARRDG